MVILIVVLVSVDNLLLQFESFIYWCVLAVLKLMLQLSLCQSHIHDRH